MSTFTDPVDLRWKQEKPGIAEVITGWKYYLNWETKDEYVLIKSGMETDGMSLPTRSWSALLNPLSALFIILILLFFRRFDGRMIKAAVTHDELYKSRIIYNGQGQTRICSKLEAESIILQACVAGGQKWINRSQRLRKWRKINYNTRCYIIYWALFFGGFVAWYKHRLREWWTKRKSDIA